MSSLGANYSGDGVAPASTDTIPAPAPTLDATPPGANVNSELNASPTCIVLDVPYAIGDLDPDAKYPHVYITTLYLNGPALSMSITYEIGTMRNGWNPAPLVPTRTLRVEGHDLVPFFAAKGDVPHALGSTDDLPPLWDQVEALMYMQIQASDARCAGSIETVAAPT